MKRPIRATAAKTRRTYLGLLRCGLSPREARGVIAEARGRARVLVRAVVS